MDDKVGDELPHLIGTEIHVDDVPLALRNAVSAVAESPEPEYWLMVTSEQGTDTDTMLAQIYFQPRKGATLEELHAKYMPHYPEGGVPLKKMVEDQNYKYYFGTFVIYAMDIEQYLWAEVEK